jgi:hypothetical protein
LVRDELDADTLDDNLDIEQHIDENDEMQPSVERAGDVPIGTGDEGNKANVPSSAVTLCDVLK